MARFEREAKLLASLNHPNIAAIYGPEQADGKRFLIMEYVEGVTLEGYIAGSAARSAGLYFNAGGTLALPAALPGLLKLALQIADPQKYPFSGVYSSQKNVNPPRLLNLLMRLSITKRSKYESLYQGSGIKCVV